MAKMETGLVVRAAGLLMVVQVLSRVLGYARDVVLVNLFGQGAVSDAFYIAFTIPDFVYNILIGGAITAAFIPIFSSYLAKDQQSEAWKVSSIFTSWVLLLMVVLLSLGFVFAEPLTDFYTKLTAEQMALPVALTRIILPQALFMAMSAIATGILQSNQHFFWPAVGVLLYNVCIIAGGVLLMQPIESLWPGFGVAGFTIGVVVGALMTLVVQIPMLRRVGYQFTPMLDTRHPGFRQLIKLIIPVLIGLSVSQINLLVTQYLATGLDDGVLTAMKTANRFMQLPIGVFAASIAIAIFPTMTTQAASGDLDEMKNSMSLGLRTSLFVMLPAAAGLIMLRTPIIRLMYEFSGKFTAADTAVASQALLFYCIGLAAYGAILILLRGFYAMQDTLTPLLISVAAILINVLFSVLLVDPLAHRGLALAYSLAGISQCLLLLLFLHKKLGRLDLRRICRSLAQSLLACAVMALAVWGGALLCESLLGVAGKMTQLVQVVVGVGLGVAVYLVCAWLLHMEELDTVLNVVKRRLHRRAAK